MNDYTDERFKCYLADCGIAGLKTVKCLQNARRLIRLRNGKKSSRFFIAIRYSTLVRYVMQVECMDLTQARALATLRRATY